MHENPEANPNPYFEPKFTITLYIFFTYNKIKASQY